ncbi:hypothetical protein ABW19_dt0204824 [Dactylella cylindrospora]|nr:hypothetical protein ABW19_dt0204824 [Dactylella cylindrospora]
MNKLGKYHIDNPNNPNRWIPFELPPGAPTIRSIRSSSSVASDAASIRTYSTKASSRAPSRRKRSMTNNHKLSRKNTKSENQFFCTFCGTSFSTKSTWKRHEESIHLMLRTWTCSPNGIIIPMSNPPPNLISSLPTPPTDGTLKTCWFCSVDRDTTTLPVSLGDPYKLERVIDVSETHKILPSHTLELHCFSHPSATTCHENSAAEKTFIRFDHFTRHMRDAHHIEGVKMKMDHNGRITEDPSHGVYQSIPGPKNSRCGFCGEVFHNWNDRVHHVSHEFWWKKRKMEEWKGDWGFDKEWMKRLQDARLPQEFTSSGSVGAGEMDVKSDSAGIPQLPGTPMLAPTNSLIPSFAIPDLDFDRDITQSRTTPRFPCDAPGCDKAFCLRKDLQRHKQTIHAEEKPEFHCPVPECKRFVHGFTRKDNLRYHIMKLHIDPNSPCFIAMQKTLANM